MTPILIDMKLYLEIGGAISILVWLYIVYCKLSRYFFKKGAINEVVKMDIQTTKEVNNLANNLFSDDLNHSLSVQRPINCSCGKNAANKAKS